MNRRPWKEKKRLQNIKIECWMVNEREKIKKGGKKDRKKDELRCKKKSISYKWESEKLTCKQL